MHPVHKARPFPRVGSPSASAPEEAAGKGNPFKNCHSCSSLLCFLFLQDDTPPVYPTSPGPVPITLAMDHIVVRRRDDGIFYLTGELPLVLLSLCTPRLCWRRLGRAGKDGLRDGSSPYVCFLLWEQSLPLYPAVRICAWCFLQHTQTGAMITF